MTWTYVVSSLATSPLYQLRLAIGDIISADPQMQDEEILQLLSGRTTLAGACADACRSLAAKYSRSVTMKSGTGGANYSDLAKAYARRADRFEEIAAMGGSAKPYAGGISEADKQIDQQNPDAVQPQFWIGMDDNADPVSPATGPYDVDHG